MRNNEWWVDQNGDGWNIADERIGDVSEAIDTLQAVNYELKSCVRGTTGAVDGDTSDALKAELLSLIDQLSDAAEML